MVESCGNTTTLKALSIFSACASIVLFLVTVPATTIIIYCLLNDQKGKFKGFFYKLLLNIAVADCLTGIVADVASINFHLREALTQDITISDTYAVHLSVFMTDAVALVTMTLLSADRLMALLKPYRYRRGMSPFLENVIILSSWPLGILIVVPYFELGYIRELAIFTAANVLLASISLITTALIYKQKFRVLETSSAARWRRTDNGFEYSHSSYSDARLEVDQTACRATEHKSAVELVRQVTVNKSEDNSSFETKDVAGTNGKFSSNPQKVEFTGSTEGKETPDAENTPKPTEKVKIPVIPTKSDAQTNDNVNDKIISKKQRSRSYVEKRVTRTFMLMLLVFIVAYVPTCVMMIYMNTCRKCDCTAVHVMRDLSVIALLSSSPLRALNFICTLKHLRRAVRKLFQDTERRDVKLQ